MVWTCSNPAGGTASLVVLTLACALGCTPAEGDTELPPLPPADTAPPEDTGPFELPDDTDDGSPRDQVPLNTLHLYQDGSLAVAPAGGPYASLTGELVVMEFLDYERPEPGDDTDLPEDTGVDPTRPWEALEESPLICEVVYRMAGALPEGEPACPDCAFVFDIEFAVASGDPEPCYDPDLPADGEIRRFGWRDADATLLYDFGGIGTWFPWYRGVRTGDTVTLTWRSTTAVSVEDDEEDE